MGQSWSVQADGGYVTETELTKLVRMQAQEAQGIAQLCNPPDEANLGKGKGDTVSYLFFRNVATTGGALTESNPIPKTKMTMVKSTFTITEYGNSLEWTEKLEDLAKVTVEHPFMRGLMDDIRKVENEQAYTQAVLTSWKATFNTTGNTLLFATNGTAPGAAAQDPEWAGLVRLIAEAEDRLIPYYDGESYVYVSGQQLVTKLRLDTRITDMLRYESPRAALNGEIGRVAGARIVKDNHKIDKTAGATSFNEGLLFGADAVQQQVGLPWEVRRQVGDYGREIGVAYYGIMGWKKMLNQTDHSQEHIIHVTST
jgi:N4-gp56 family major capsid protein